MELQLRMKSQVVYMHHARGVCLWDLLAYRLLCEIIKKQVIVKA